MAIKTDSTVDDPEMLDDGTQYLGEYRPPDYEVIGADGGLFGGGLGQPNGSLADVLRTDIEYAPGYYPGQGIVVGSDDADRLGIGGNIFLSNPNLTGVTAPISTIPKGPAGSELTGAVPGISPGEGVGGATGGPTATVNVGGTPRTVVFDDIVRGEINKEIALLGQQGIASNDERYGTRIMEAANRGVSIYEAQTAPARDVSVTPGSGTSTPQGGIPLIIPVPGLDPATAAILTAAGLIFSGGKIARLNPQNPVGSVAGAVQGVGQTGQNVINVATGQTTIGEIWDPGSTGAPSGATGGGAAAGTGGQQTTGTGAIGAVGGIFGGGMGGASGAGASTGSQQTTGGTVGVAPGALGGSTGQAAAGAGKPASSQQPPSTGGPYIFDSAERTQNILGQILAPSQAINQAAAAAAAAQGTGSTGGGSGGDVGGGATSVGVLPTAQEQPTEPTPVDTSSRAGDTTTTTCPSPDTPILLADGSEIAAGQLKPGMLVRTSHEHSKKWGNYPVSRVQIVRDKRICLVLDQGRFVCSPSHKFSTGNDWKEAKDYKAGDALQHRTIVAVCPLEDGDVVSITVEDAHTYISDGLLSHNKTPIYVPPPTSTTTNEAVKTDTPIITPPPNTVTPTSSTTPTSTSTAATPIVINAPTVGYTLPSSGTPAQRNLYTEAGTTLSSLASPMQQFQIGVDASGKPIYGTVPSSGGRPLTLSEAIAQGYGGLAGGMREADVQNLFGAIGAATGRTPTAQTGYQAELNRAAAEQTAAANAALRLGNVMDAELLSARAQALRQQANLELFGAGGALPQYTQQAREQAMRDVAALRTAEAGQLTPEQIRNAQQAAREAYAARGQVFSEGAKAQEVLNRQQAIQQQQQIARQNLAQSMGQLGQGVAYQTANIFDPMGATLGAQYGMQSQNVGMNQALYNQAMGLTSGAGGYGFAQQMINPFTGYAQDVYGTNVNALNAAQIAAANRQAALEAAKMGQTGTYAQALGGLIASGGLGQIQSGISGGIQGLLNLLGGQWPTGSSSMITPTVARPGT